MGDRGSEVGSALRVDPMWGSIELKSCEIMAWAEVGRLTDWAAQVPLDYFKYEKDL